jgi:hypothetical protein
MVADTESHTSDRPVASRRQYLAGLAATALVATAGCADFGTGGGTDGEGDTVEIIVSNHTQEPANIAVRVADSDGVSLFDRVYELEAGHMDESGGVDVTPATVTAFTPEGEAASWEYAPPGDTPCDGVDFVVELAEPTGLEATYTC